MELQRWDVTTDQWRKDPNGIWVKADDAIRREAELLARIGKLESRAKESAALVLQAIALIHPPQEGA